jgi:hypothetical protein
MNYTCPIPDCGYKTSASLSLESHIRHIHSAPRPTGGKLERTEFNKDWLDGGRAAGFTDAQLAFLERWHTPPAELDDLL